MPFFSARRTRTDIQQNTRAKYEDDRGVWGERFDVLVNDSEGFKKTGKEIELVGLCRTKTSARLISSIRLESAEPCLDFNTASQSSSMDNYGLIFLSHCRPSDNYNEEDDDNDNREG